MQTPHQYTGRYAPSPTGDLHLGNLRTALLAWLHARMNNGRFLLRIEDLDTPRTVPGSADRILFDLQWLGLDWDGDVVYQSQRSALYQAALDDLFAQDLCYYCFCSRKDIQLAASAPHGKQSVYPGTCQSLTVDEQAQKLQHQQASVRLRVNDQLSRECGDFVIRRADKLFAYQLAVVVDDLEQGVSDVVRGEDLLDSTDRQRYLAHLLSPSTPAIAYHHVPLMLNQSGQRMAKRDGSESLERWRSLGKTPEQLLGHLAYGLGITQSGDAIRLSELLQISDLMKKSLFFKQSG